MKLTELAKENQEDGLVTLCNICGYQYRLQGIWLGRACCTCPVCAECSEVFSMGQPPTNDGFAVMDDGKFFCRPTCFQAYYDLSQRQMDTAQPYLHPVYKGRITDAMLAKIRDHGEDEDSGNDGEYDDDWGGDDYDYASDDDGDDEEEDDDDDGDEGEDAREDAREQ